jgi:hypothetical protein
MSEASAHSETLPMNCGSAITVSTLTTPDPSLAPSHYFPVSRKTPLSSADSVWRPSPVPASVQIDVAHPLPLARDPPLLPNPPLPQRPAVDSTRTFLGSLASTHQAQARSTTLEPCRLPRAASRP